MARLEPGNVLATTATLCACPLHMSVIAAMGITLRASAKAIGGLQMKSQVYKMYVFLLG